MPRHGRPGTRPSPGKGDRKRPLGYRGTATCSGGMMLGDMDPGVDDEKVGVVMSGSNCTQAQGG